MAGKQVIHPSQIGPVQVCKGSAVHHALGSVRFSFESMLRGVLPPACPPTVSEADVALASMPSHAKSADAR